MMKTHLFSCLLGVCACLPGSAVEFQIPQRHQPKTVMGRDFWRVLYKYGDWACWDEWASPARLVRFDHPEIYRHPAFTDVVWSYFGRKPPAMNGGTVLIGSLRDQFLDYEADREILASNPVPDRPFFMQVTGKRRLEAWIAEPRLDHAEYDAFLKTHPNLVFDGTMGEWCCDLLLAYRRMKGLPPQIRRKLVDLIGTEPPSDRREFVRVLRRYYDMRARANYNGRIRVLDGHLNSFHLAYDFGAHMIVLESTDTCGNGTTPYEDAIERGFVSTGSNKETMDNSVYRYAVQAMFARGAARQFNRLWEWYVAGYTNGWTDDGQWWNNTVTVYPESATAPEHYGRCSWNCGPEWGQSVSNLNRVHYLAYLSGANFVNFEEWSAQLTQWDKATGRTVLSPRAKFYLDFANFTREHPGRGAVYAPIAIAVPVGQGYPTFGGEPWCIKRFGYTRGDAAVDAVFFTLVPGFERAKEHLRGVEYDLQSSPFAQMYDVIAPDIASQSGDELLEVFRGYKAIVVVGDYPDRGFEKTLAQYASEGGRVIRIGENEVPPVSRSQINDIKGGKLTFRNVEKIFRGLQDEYFPLRVTGDVAYGLNRTKDSWWLWAFNSRGVIKFVNRPERIDRSCDAKIAVSMPRGFATSVRELICGKDVAVVADGSFQFTVPAGGLAIFEMKK